MIFNDASYVRYGQTFVERELTIRLETFDECQRLAELGHIVGESLKTNPVIKDRYSPSELAAIQSMASALSDMRYQW